MVGLELAISAVSMVQYMIAKHAYADSLCVF
jgi:hypothetical protein